MDFDNPWVSVVAPPTRRRSAILVVILAPLLVFASLQLGGAAAKVSLAFDIGSKAALSLTQTAAVFAPLWIAAVFGARLEGRRAWRNGPSPALTAGAGLTGGVIAFLAVGAVISLAGVVETSGDRMSLTLVNVMAGLLIVAVQATTEEVFFRGWIQPSLCTQLGPWAGLVATSALFAAVHLLGGMRSLPSLANTFLAGFVFGLLALRTGGLWAPVAAHFGWNYAEAHILGLDPNPGLSPLGSLLDVDAVGPQLWSGSSDGMNASLATTLVLGACCIPLILVHGRKAQA